MGPHRPLVVQRISHTIWIHILAMKNRWVLKLARPGSACSTPLALLFLDPVLQVSLCLIMRLVDVLLAGFCPAQESHRQPVALWDDT